MLLGIDISSRDIAVILAQDDGGAIVALRAELPREGGVPAVWRTSIETARQAMARGSIEPTQVVRAGLAIDLPIDERGIVGRGRNTVGWEGVDLPQVLRRDLGVAKARAASRVLCEALGEGRFGALRPVAEQPYREWLF